MGCSPAGYKTFLVVCNIGLLFIGLAILSIGLKMKSALEVFNLQSIAFLSKAVKAVTATGFVITLTGGTGFCGSCYEILWMIIIHLAGLGIIVVMEFSISVVIIVIKKTVESALEDSECGQTCVDTVQFVVDKLATPSAAVMVVAIIVEALMIYSAVQLYYYIRDKPKISPAAGQTTNVVVQNVQMQPVIPPQPTYVMGPPPPQPAYMPQPMYAPPPQQHPAQYPAPQPQPPSSTPAPQPVSTAAPRVDVDPPAYVETIPPPSMISTPNSK